MDDPKWARQFLTLSSIGGSATDFTASIGQQLNLPGEPSDYEVALCELSVSVGVALDYDDLNVFTDLIPRSQVIGTTPQPLLRSLLGAVSITTGGGSERFIWQEDSTVVPFRPLAATSFRTVQIRIADRNGDTLPPGPDPSTAVVCIRHLTRA